MPTLDLQPGGVIIQLQIHIAKYVLWKQGSVQSHCQQIILRKAQPNSKEEFICWGIKKKKPLICKIEMWFLSGSFMVLVISYKHTTWIRSSQPITMMFIKISSTANFSHRSETCHACFEYTYFCSKVCLRGDLSFDTQVALYSLSPTS